MTKVLTVRVAPELLSRADAKAAMLGLDRTQYVRHLILADLAEPSETRGSRFKSEDLAGRFRLGGQSATNPRVRNQLRNKAKRARETDC
jgi:hypothetical protein